MWIGADGGLDGGRGGSGLGTRGPESWRGGRRNRDGCFLWAPRLLPPRVHRVEGQHTYEAGLPVDERNLLAGSEQYFDEKLSTPKVEGTGQYADAPAVEVDVPGRTRVAVGTVPGFRDFHGYLGGGRDAIQQESEDDKVAVSGGNLPRHVPGDRVGGGEFEEAGVGARHAAGDSFQPLRRHHEHAGLG